MFPMVATYKKKKRKPLIDVNFITSYYCRYCCLYCYCQEVQSETT